MAPAAARDLATAGAVALFAGAYLVLGRGLEAGAVNGVPGPGAFPRLLGLCMLACAAVLAVRGAAALRPGRAPATPGAAPASGTDRRRVLALYALFVLYVLAMPYAGFPLATFVFSAVAMAGVLGLGVRASAVYAGGLALLAWGLFRVLLDVPLPAGRFG